MAAEEELLREAGWEPCGRGMWKDPASGGEVSEDTAVRRARKDTVRDAPAVLRDDYKDFIAAKAVCAPARGFEPGALSEVLFPFQRDVVAWGCRRGCAAIFAAFGLGFELSPRYHADAVGYCRAAERAVAVPTLFDLDVDAEDPDAR